MALIGGWKLGIESIFTRTGDAFGLKDKDVKNTLEELKAEKVEVKKRMDDLLEKNKEYLIGRLQDIDGQIGVLSASPKEVLKKVASFNSSYKDMVGVESQTGTKIKPELFFNLLIEQNPNVSSYYPLLRKTPSGLKFGQQVLSAQARQQAAIKR